MPPAGMRVAALMLVLPVFFLASCRLPGGAPPGSAAEAARELRRSSAGKSVKARLSADGTRLQIRFSLTGRDAWATAAVDGKDAGGVGGLTFQPDGKAATALLGRHSRPVPVAGPAVWRQLADTLALRVAPAGPLEGTLITAGGRELIAWRKDGKGALMPLKERPRGLRIVRKIRENALRDEVFADRGDALDRPGGQTGPLLLLTGTFPELVLLDHRARRLQFFSVPPEDSAGLPLEGTLAKSDNVLRQLTSFIWRSNVLAVLKNPFSTASRTLASGTSMTAAGLGQVLNRLPAGPPPPVRPSPPMDLTEWGRELEKIASAPEVPATLRIRLGGEEFFPDFIQAVQNARETVDVQLYIIDNDDYAVSLADLLKRRSREGVRVRVLMDESASLLAAASPPESPMPADFSPPPDMVGYLRAGSRIQVRCTPMPALSASHTKIISVDRQVAWLGGMNFGQEYRYDWHDLMIEVRGPLVQWIRQDFARAWARHGWAGDLAVARQKWFSPERKVRTEGAPAGSIPVRPLYTSSWEHEIAEAQIAAMRRARSRIWVENAYLSDGAYLAEMIRARHRGVDVRLILPADNDNGIMAANNRALVPLLRRHGIRIWLLPGMSHVKAALYDGWACVGSANFDRLSLRVNNEFSIGFSDPGMTGALQRRLFETDFRRSREITAKPEPGPADEVMNALIRSLAGQL